MSDPGRARLFVAAEIGDEARRELSRLPHSIPNAKFVRAEHLHVTLRFLGNTDRARIADLNERLARSAANSRRFSIAIRGLGIFPPKRAPRVLWAALEPAEPLVRLAADVERACVEAGFPPESREVSPHVTLARFRIPPPASELSSYLEVHGRIQSPEFRVAEIVLFESVLSTAGPTYTPRASLPLSGGLSGRKA